MTYDAWWEYDETPEDEEGEIKVLRIYPTEKAGGTAGGYIEVCIFGSEDVSDRTKR